jgi:stage II sporulation protein D
MLLFVLCAGASAQTVRVGLVRHLRGVSEVTVTSTSDFSVRDESGKPLVTATVGERIVLRKSEDGIELIRSGGEQSEVGKELQIVSSTSDAFIAVSGVGCSMAQYRGAIEAKLCEKGISFINVVDIEDYLLGVLPSEMPADFKTEALKAQAVAARTYACAHFGRHGKQGYDLCDGTDCQVYLGATGEKAPTTSAVRQTAGMVAVYHGQLISALYSSDCGGSTQDGGEPYLTCVPDNPGDTTADYCSHDGHTWTRSWRIEDFEKLLRKTYPDLSGVNKIAVTDTDSSCRAKEVKFDATSGAVTIPAARLRTLLGNTVIKSTAFSVKLEDGNVIFEGKGFGHGIGLCQFGANGLASAPNGYTFEQILKHYYSGVEIVPVSSVKATAHLTSRSPLS